MSEPGLDARRVALDVLGRIERDGAFANLVLGTALDRSGLPAADRALVTDLVYGTTRQRRALDFLVDRFLSRDVDRDVRTALRLGAYQLHTGRVPPHAAVHTTVGAAPRRARSLVNAVLRRLAEAEAAGTPIEWPNDATRLSYPDWIVDRLVVDLGEADALAALAAMNEPATADVRADGYVQDRASQWVAASVEARPDERIADLCAAPGGKATALAATGAFVLAGDIRPSRVRLVARNARRGDAAAASLAVVTGDARHPAVRRGSLDRVLLDAPCTGLGALRRRADARWRISADAVARLADLQWEIIDAAVPLLRTGGTLVYSVCTLTRAESTAIDEQVGERWPDLEPLAPPDGPWRPWGRGALVLPQDAQTDGMALFRYRRR